MHENGENVTAPIVILSKENGESSSSSVNEATRVDNGIRNFQAQWYLKFQKPAVNLEWKDLSLSVKRGKSILNNLYGEARAGELLAVMGPSGAGKSTLFNILSGFSQKRVTGQILVNGRERDMGSFKQMSSYVMQEDKVHPNLTVKEALIIAASLKLFANFSNKEKNDAVEECLKYFRLKDQENTRGRFLSGGEKKRLCIAQEIISNPSIIFLDEPTTGLDMSSCLQVMRLLKNLAEEGRTVICSIHQPNAKTFKTFDKVYLMAEGDCIYRGRTDRVVPFFADFGICCPTYHNPADFVIEIALKKLGDHHSQLKEIARHSLNNIENSNGEGHDISKNDSEVVLNASTLYSEDKKMEGPSTVRNKNPEKFFETTRHSYALSFQQFRIIYHRSILSVIRDPLSNYLSLTMYVASGIMFGTLNYKMGGEAEKILNNTTFMFFIVTLVSYMSMISTLLLFPLEIDILKREYLNNWYNLRAFYLARTLAEIPLQLAYAILFCSLIYWLTEQPLESPRPIHFLFNMILLALVAQAQAFVYGGCFSVTNAVFLGPVMTIPPTAFCGFFISAKAAPVYYQWLYYISYLRWAMENNLVILYSWNRNDLNCTEQQCSIKDAEDVLTYFDIEESNVYVNYAAQGALIAVFWFLGYLVVSRRIKSKMFR